MKEQLNGLVYGLFAGDANARPATRARVAGLDYSAPSTTSLPVNTWTHVAATYDGSAVRLFVNGVPTASVPASGLIDASTNPLRIGGDAVWGDYFQGRIDEVRVYDKPLTQAEIQKDMNTPIERGLVAAYNFDEGTGTVAADASGNGRTGTVAGATWVTTGKFGNALKFDGVQSLVRVADADALDLTDRMTIDAWVYPTALSGWRTVVLKAAGPTGLAYGLYANNNAPQPAMTVKVQGTDQSATGTAKLPLNAWTFLSATYDGAMLRMFVNGTQVGSLALSGSIVTSSDLLTIGGNLVWGEYFQGRIDNVRIYNRPLSASEIQTDMQTAVVP
jgi:hydrogenase maturation factor HypE